MIKIVLIFLFSTLVLVAALPLTTVPKDASAELKEFHKALKDARNQLQNIKPPYSLNDPELVRQRRRTIDELLASFQNGLSIEEEAQAVENWYKTVNPHAGKNTAFGEDWRDAHSKLQRRVDSTKDSISMLNEQLSDVHPNLQSSKTLFSIVKNKANPNYNQQHAYAVYSAAAEPAPGYTYKNNEFMQQPGSALEKRDFNEFAKPIEGDNMANLVYNNNDQLSTKKNDLSHELYYKLSKIEQDAADQRKMMWNWRNPSKRAYGFNAMNEIKLKTSNRLMDKGYGPALPSNSLDDHQQQIKVDEILRQREAQLGVDQNKSTSNNNLSYLDELDQMLGTNVANVNAIDAKNQNYEQNLNPYSTNNEVGMGVMSDTGGVGYGTGLGVGSESSNDDRIVMRQKRISEVKNISKELAKFIALQDAAKVIRPKRLTNELQAAAATANANIAEANMHPQPHPTGTSQNVRHLDAAFIEDNAMEEDENVKLDFNGVRTKRSSVANKSMPASVNTFTSAWERQYEKIRHSLLEQKESNENAHMRKKRSIGNSYDELKQNMHMPLGNNPDDDDGDMHISSLDYVLGKSGRTFDDQRFDNLKSKEDRYDGVKFDNVWYEQTPKNRKTEQKKTNSDKYNWDRYIDNEPSNGRERSNANSRKNPENDQTEDGKSYKEIETKMQQRDGGAAADKEMILTLRDEILNSSAFAKLETMLKNAQVEKVTQPANNVKTDANKNPDVSLRVLTIKQGLVAQNAKTTALPETATDRTNGNNAAAAALKKDDFVKLNITINASVDSDKAKELLSNGSLTFQSGLNANTKKILEKRRAYDRGDSNCDGHRSDTGGCGNGNNDRSDTGSCGRGRTDSDEPNTCGDNHDGNRNSGSCGGEHTDRDDSDRCNGGGHDDNDDAGKCNKSKENNADKNASLESLASGQLSSDVVKSIFSLVRCNPKMKPLWPSLKRNKPPTKTQLENFYAIRNTQNEEEMHKSEDMLKRAMETINQIIDSEVRSRTCVPLRPDLVNFYEMILKNFAEQEETRAKRDNSMKSTNDFTKELHGIDPSMIEEKTQLVKKLLKQYDDLSAEDQEQVSHVRDDLLKDLMLLRKLKEGEDMLEERRKRNIENKEQSQKNIKSRDDAKVIKKIETQFTPQYLKLLKTSELFKEADSDKQQ